MEEKVAYQSYERARDIQVQPGPQPGEVPDVLIELAAARGGGFTKWGMMGTDSSISWGRRTGTWMKRAVWGGVERGARQARGRECALCTGKLTGEGCCAPRPWLAALPVNSRGFQVPPEEAGVGSAPPLPVASKTPFFYQPPQLVISKGLCPQLQQLSLSLPGLWQGHAVHGPLPQPTPLPHRRPWSPA